MRRLIICIASYGRRLLYDANGRTYMNEKEIVGAEITFTQAFSIKNRKIFLRRGTMQNMIEFL